MSFYWYDLETFGQDPRRTRIAQFAGLRTDDDLSPIDEPLVMYCQPADDLLPSPEATLVTGITPQQAQREGLREADFVNRLLAELALPHTCAVGYNSLRFDDEFVRCALYRNFHDPYEREWKNGNSRWDLLDVMRLTHALRPNGIHWPLRADGAPSFRLTDLTAANGIAHEGAHDALADVRALVDLARRLKQAQPRLFDYALKLRDKRFTASLLDIAAMKPVLHISGKYPAIRHNAALVAPICQHPTIGNRVIAFDLDTDPQALLDLDADDITDRLYTPAADLPEGERRIAIKEIHLNRCPMLVALDGLRAPDFQRLGIDPEAALQRAQILRDAPGLAEKLRRVFARGRDFGKPDADAALYDGFVADADKRWCDAVRKAVPAALPAFAARFKDPRLSELLFRYQARNWPESLNAAQRERWNAYRRSRLDADVGLSEYSFETHAARIAALRAQHANDGRVQVLLDALEAWAGDLRAGLS